MSELARLTRILGQAMTTDELPPEDPGIVELGDEVVVEFAAGDTERFLVVDPIEAPLDDVRISVESPLAQALVGRRVGEQVEVNAPAGRYRCRILTTGRYQTAAPSVVQDQPIPAKAYWLSGPDNHHQHPSPRHQSARASGPASIAGRAAP